MRIVIVLIASLALSGCVFAIGFRTCTAENPCSYLECNDIACEAP